MSPLILAFPPVGSASTTLQTLQVTMLTALLKISCSLPHLGHFTRTNVLLGFGINLFHSLIFFTLLSYYQFSKSDAVFVPHETADLALQPQCLLFRGFGEFFLERVFLSTVAFFFAFVVAFTHCHGSAFACFVQGDGVSLMNFTFRTVCCDFFGNVHLIHDQLCIKKTCVFLYFFALLCVLVAV